MCHELLAGSSCAYGASNFTHVLVGACFFYLFCLPSPLLCLLLRLHPLFVLARHHTSAPPDDCELDVERNPALAQSLAWRLTKPAQAQTQTQTRRPCCGGGGG